MKRKQDIIVIVGLSIFSILLIFSIIPSGHLFGSETDWLSQHITLADVIRQRFYETHDLFMDYLPQLGGGQNVYQISYYGLFRPDVLISLLLPSVAMKDIIVVSMMLSSIGSVVFCYVWIRKHSESIFIATIVSLLLLCSGPLLFHAHRQLMFVNYMPWLFMGLYAIDQILAKGKGHGLLVVSVILMILNSYFYSVSAIIVLFIYAAYQVMLKVDKGFIKKWFLCMYPVLLGILVCGILLFPTFMVMLESGRGGGGVSWTSLFIPNLAVSGLLYQSYGAGFTMIVWAMLVVGWKHQVKAIRYMSRILTLVFIFPVIPFVMNGGLYTRAKILIVFLPLIVYYVALYLKHIHKKSLQLWHLPFIAMPLLFSMTNKAIVVMLAIDTVLSILVLYLLQQPQKKQVFLVMNVVALISCFTVNRNENFVSDKQYEAIYNEQKDKLLKQYVKSDGRFEDLTNSMNTSNLIQSENMYKPSYYSSIKNQAYNTFFYDVIKNPMSIRNRVAMVSSNNVFFQGMMGTKYLYSSKLLPAGYEKIAETKQGVLGKNENVMPKAYATSNLMSEDVFKKYSYPQSLDVLYNHAIVESEGNTPEVESAIKEIPIPFTLVGNQHLQVRQTETGYVMKADKDTHITIPVTPLTDQDVLLLQFDVIPKKVAYTKNVTITINGVKNTLSSRSANYPNDNTTFHYTLSNNQPYQTLHISVSKGTYELRNMKSHTMNLSAINQRRSQVDEMKLLKTQGKEVLKGKVEVMKDGYLITSLPYQQGYEVLVDGKVVTPKKVNTAFVGLPITSGHHQITIQFHAPGKKIGWIMSGSGIAIWCATTLVRRFYERKKRTV